MASRKSVGAAKFKSFELRFICFEHVVIMPTEIMKTILYLPLPDSLSACHHINLVREIYQ